MEFRSATAISAGLHVAVLLWAVVSFSGHRLEATPVDSLPVDLISEKEFSEVTSTVDELKPLARASGGDARRIADGSGVDIPRIVPVHASSVFRGDGWMGVRMRDASVVRGVGVLPVFAGLIGLLLLLGAFAATWLREGR